MKVKHKVTGEISEVSYHKWKHSYLPRKLDENYDIIEKDTVILRTVNNDGSRGESEEYDRDHALRMMKMRPNDYVLEEVSSPPGGNFFLRILKGGGTIIHDIIPANQPIKNIISKSVKWIFTSVIVVIAVKILGSYLYERYFKYK